MLTYIFILSVCVCVHVFWYLHEKFKYLPVLVPAVRFRHFTLSKLFLLHFHFHNFFFVSFPSIPFWFYFAFRLFILFGSLLQEDCNRYFVQSVGRHALVRMFYLWFFSHFLYSHPFFIRAMVYVTLDFVLHTRQFSTRIVAAEFFFHAKVTNKKRKKNWFQRAKCNTGWPIVIHYKQILHVCVCFIRCTRFIVPPRCWLHKFFLRQFADCVMRTAHYARTRSLTPGVLIRTLVQFSCAYMNSIGPYSIPFGVHIFPSISLLLFWSFPSSFCVSAIKGRI